MLFVYVSNNHILTYSGFIFLRNSYLVGLQSWLNREGEGAMLSKHNYISKTRLIIPIQKFATQAFLLRVNESIYNLVKKISILF